MQECNSPAYFDLLENGRSRSEMLIKTLALQVACTCAFGHLLSMQRHSSKTQVTRVCASLLTPGLPIALFVKNTIDTVAHAQGQRKRHRDEHSPPLSWRYCLSAVLGAQALPSDHDGNESKGVSLSATYSATRQFELTSAPYDWRLLGRTVMLLAFTVQAGVALAQWVRRVAFSYQNTFVSEGNRQPYHAGGLNQEFPFVADTPLDHLNALAVISGLTASFNGLCLSAMNSSWKYRDAIIGHDLSGDIAEAVSTVDQELPLSALMRFGFLFDVLVLSRMTTLYLLSPTLSALRLNLWRAYHDAGSISIMILCGWGWLGLIIIPLLGLHWAIAPLRPRFGLALTSRWLRALRSPVSCFGLSLSGFRVRLRMISWPQFRPLSSWPDELGVMGLTIALWRAANILITFVTLQYMGHELSRLGPVPTCSGFDCYLPFYVWKDSTLDRVWTF